MNYYKKMKLALRGNLPLIEDRDTQNDPYSKRRPEDGKGFKMTTMGDENGFGASGLGQNERAGQPNRDDISVKKEETMALNTDLPSTKTNLIPDKDDYETTLKDSGPPNYTITNTSGPNNNTFFTDQNDPLHQHDINPSELDRPAHGDINSQIQQGNVDKTVGIFEKAKRRIRGGF